MCWNMLKYLKSWLCDCVGVLNGSLLIVRLIFVWFMMSLFDKELLDEFVFFVVVCYL